MAAYHSDDPITELVRTIDHTTPITHRAYHRSRSYPWAEFRPTKKCTAQPQATRSHAEESSGQTYIRSGPKQITEGVSRGLGIIDLPNSPSRRRGLNRDEDIEMGSPEAEQSKGQNVDAGWKGRKVPIGDHTRRATYRTFFLTKSIQVAPTHPSLQT